MSQKIVSLKGQLSIDAKIVNAISDHETRFFIKPGKLFLGKREWKELDSHIIEHFGTCLEPVGDPDVVDHYRGCDLYQVNEESYLFCAP